MTSFSIALLTDPAHVRPLACVHSHVFVQGPFLAEDFFANSADMGNLSSTHFHISNVGTALITGRAVIELPSQMEFLAVIGKGPCIARN